MTDRRKQSPEKLGLGTAQFGMDYGVSNAVGQTCEGEVRCILDYAHRQGVRLLDTAASYGTSEVVLGKTLGPDHGFRIVTKIGSCSGGGITAEVPERVVRTFRKSLERLDQPHVYGLLVHSCEDVLGPGGDRLVDVLQELKMDGLVQKVGVSVYTGEQIEAVLSVYRPDIIQLAVNLLDQRLLQGGYLGLLESEGIEIHARSVFLQGLLLVDPADVHPYFEPIRSHLRRMHRENREYGLTPLEAALDFVVRQDQLDTVLVGVTTLNELEAICSAMSHLPDKEVDYSRWAIDDARFLNPSLWELTADAPTGRGGA